MDHFVYLCGICIQLLTIVFALHLICKPKYSFAVTLLLYFAAIEIGYIFFTFLLNIPVAETIHSLYKIGLCVAVPFVFYKDSLLKKIIISVSTVLSQLIIEQIAIVSICGFYNITKAELMAVNGFTHFGILLCSDMCMIVYVLIGIICRWKDMSFRKNIRFLLIMIIFTMIHTVSIAVYYYDKSVVENPNNSIIQLVYQTILYILIFAQYYSTLRSQKLITAEANIRQLEAEMQHTYDYYMLADDKFQEISGLRHDMQNQIQTVKHLMQDKKNTDEAREIITEIDAKLASAKAVQFCSNPIINSLLTLKMNSVQKNGIDTEIILRDCDKLSLDNYDICSLFANLFDNACEACIKLPENEERFIEMKSELLNGCFVLKVRNSCREPSKKRKGRLPETTKEEAGHGFGTKIIDSIAGKYDGSFSMKYADGIMESAVVLPMNVKVNS